jgi:hypothetical protein
MCQKKVKFCFPVKYVNIHIFFPFNLAVKKTVGDGEELLTYLNSALKVPSGLDIFPRWTKKSYVLLTSVIRMKFSFRLSIFGDVALC